MMNDELWNQETRDSYYLEDKMPAISPDTNEVGRGAVKTVDKILLRGHSQPQLLAQKQQQQGKVNKPKK